ncbi:MAG: hypothetical protein OXE17_15495 [Chloroflexi bacterium]|nr:hypothetical protein [Chloroflexota bacterium]
MPTVRIDDEVYEWLQSLAVPFQDTPNSVLRRVAGLEDASTSQTEIQTNSTMSESENEGEKMASTRTSGRELSRTFGISGKQSLYSDTGTFYENLTRFPGILWDRHGYVRFLAEDDYLRSPYLQIGKKLNVPNGGISSIPGYTWAR